MTRIRFTNPTERLFSFRWVDMKPGVIYAVKRSPTAKPVLYVRHPVAGAYRRAVGVTNVSTGAFQSYGVDARCTGRAREITNADLTLGAALPNAEEQA